MRRRYGERRNAEEQKAAKIAASSPESRDQSSVFSFDLLVAVSPSHRFIFQFPAIPAFSRVAGVRYTDHGLRIKDHGLRFRPMHDHFVGGHWIAGSGDPLIAVNPINHPHPFTTRKAIPAEVAAALDAAANAQFGWSTAPLDRRIDIAKKYAKTLQQKKESLAAQISNEVGKPLWESRQEVDTMIRKVDLSIQAYHDRTGTREQPLNDALSVVTHRAHGIVVVLGPFNFPGHLPNGHIVPAILAGNCVLFKPSEFTPGVGALMTDCWNESGLPAGVLNLVQGDRTTAESLLSDPRINGVYFTGSAAAGISIHQRFAGRPEVILALEMGGNNAMIVLSETTDAARTAAVSAFLTSGQRCTCTRRLIVVGAAEQVLAPLVECARKIRVGPPEAKSFMGPVIHRQAAERVLAFQKKLVDEGASILEECKTTDLGLPYLRPGIVDVTKVQGRADEEIFGPLLQVIRVNGFDEAIEEANNTRFGLAAALLGGTQEQFQIFRERVRAGVINWNRPTTGASSAAPFGGIGISGNHRPTALYAADYCAYPIATVQSETLQSPVFEGLE
jgi:succinylglutamic semialdehyde dehydrogenase